MIDLVKEIVLAFDRGPTGDPFLDARYDWQTRTFNEAPYYRLFYRLSQALRPKMVLELGAWQGTGAAHWAPHAGTVATIDHHTDPGDGEHERLCREAAQRYANLFYVKGWTWDVRQEIRDLGKRIDVLFVDSWHHHDKAMRDWDTYRDMLRPDGALVICDDVCDVEPTLHDMVRFWEEISGPYERFLVKGLATYDMGFFLYEET